MAGHPGQKGYVDYVLFGKDGLPLAVIEAKRSSKDPNIGRKQAMLYADCLEQRFDRRPMMFTTNGFETYFGDDKSSPQRKVSGLFSKDTLQKFMTRRSERKDRDHPKNCVNLQAGVQGFEGAYGRSQSGLCRSG